MEHLIKPSPIKSTFCNGKFKNDMQIGGGQSATGESSTYASVLASNLFYEEYEYERRLKKRRARLVAAADDAFSQIKHLVEEREKCKTIIPILMLFSVNVWLMYRILARSLQNYIINL